MDDDSDPTDFDGSDIPSLYGDHGVLPVLLPDQQPAVKKDPRSNAATGATAAGVRAFTAQAVAFYFRAPVKAFFRTRVDYLAYARSISQETTQSLSRAGRTARYESGIWMRIFAPWWRASTPGLLTNAVKTYGWRVIPEQILPPLLANVTVGAILYTSYLQILGRLHEPSSEVRKRVYPPPELRETFVAGTLAGGIQSLVAAPLDALQVRYDRQLEQGNGNGNGHSHVSRDKTMFAYSKDKLKEIGVRGVFAGWGLSFAKDSLGSGVFFSTFEWVKAQGYYRFVRWYYSALGDDVVDLLAKKRPDTRERHGSKHREKTIIKPHYALEPAFLMLAGMSATVAQQGIIFPLALVQSRHFERLEDLDKQAKQITAEQNSRTSRGHMLRAYYHAYQETWRECQTEAAGAGGLRRMLYRGFWWNTIRQVPSTSAGLIIFELVRRKYGMNTDEVRINQDGYDILLT